MKGGRLEPIFLYFYKLHFFTFSSLGHDVEESFRSRSLDRVEVPIPRAVPYRDSEGKNQCFEVEIESNILTVRITSPLPTIAPYHGLRFTSFYFKDGLVASKRISLIRTSIQCDSCIEVLLSQNDPNYIKIETIEVDTQLQPLCFDIKTNQVAVQATIAEGEGLVDFCFQKGEIRQCDVTKLYKCSVPTKLCVKNDMCCICNCCS